MVFCASRHLELTIRIGRTALDNERGKILHHNASSACLTFYDSLKGFEEIVFNRVRKQEEPLIIIVNSVYYFHYDEGSNNMLCNFSPVQTDCPWTASGMSSSLYSSTVSKMPPHALCLRMRRHIRRLHVVINNLTNKNTFSAAGHVCTCMPVSLAGGRRAHGKASNAVNMVKRSCSSKPASSSPATRAW